MQKYDLTPINNELKRAVEGTENTLETEVKNLVARFTEYQDEVEKVTSLSALTDEQIRRLDDSVKHFTKAFDLIKEILHSGGSNDDKVAMLKKVVQ